MYRPPDTDEGTCTNFIITAEDVAGPWSQPHVIEDAPGQGEKPAGAELMGVRLSSIFCFNSERFMEVKRFALMIFK